MAKLQNKLTASIIMKHSIANNGMDFLVKINTFNQICRTIKKLNKNTKRTN